MLRGFLCELGYEGFNIILRLINSDAACFTAVPEEALIHGHGPPRLLDQTKLYEIRRHAATIIYSHS